MSVRLACNWLREQMVTTAEHRLAVGPERAAREADLHDVAVAEVDDWLDPPEHDEPAVDPWTDPEWVAAMGGEMAEVG